MALCSITLKEPLNPNSRQAKPIAVLAKQTLTVTLINRQSLDDNRRYFSNRTRQDERADADSSDGCRECDEPRGHERQEAKTKNQKKLLYLARRANDGPMGAALYDGRRDDETHNDIEETQSSLRHASPINEIHIPSTNPNIVKSPPSKRRSARHRLH